MSSNPNSLLNLLVFPKDCQLTGISNWATFLDHLKSVIHSTGLLSYLNGSIQAPIAPTPVTGATAPAVASPVPTVPTLINSHSPSVEEWELRDSCLAGIIYQNIKDPRSIGVTEDMSSNAMWRKLTGKYKTNLAAAQALAKECIQQFKYSPGTPFEDHFKQLEALCKAANNIGCSVQDEDLHTRFFTSLSTDYLWILQTHSACPYSDLKCTLLKYNMMVESANTTNPATMVPSALTVSNGIVCKNCNHNGHMKKGCWARGGGCKGLRPCWYKAPKGIEPVKTHNTSAAATTTKSPPIAAATATIYQFNNNNFDSTDSLPCHLNSPGYSNPRLGRKTHPILSKGGDNSGSVVVFAVSSNNNTCPAIPMYLNSAASHWCIHEQ
ncbi:hypothetical protein GYMLUDRAFT_250499 [Collybiopsis luxurians FD-317 M1]|uniref:CCHC-type domain-containing protein n=1 Tax=Collybiopsis luxurians FD-317 M1 TaxID=944289 RepID=A0A0D0BF08_9AGAR|nr:hypothetical protein GYMLUDRAFT_250499 [Collybiopsis luxurians FD-317 M1]